MAATLSLTGYGRINGSSIGFTLSGAPPLTSIDIDLRTVKLNFLYVFTTKKTDSSGNLSGTIVIGTAKGGVSTPEPSGDYYIAATDNTNNTIIAKAPFTILNPNVALSLTPVSSSQLSFTLTNGPVNTSLVYEAFSQPDSAPFSTDSTGSYSGTIPIPQSLATGTYNILIKDPFSGVVVAKSSYTISLIPTSLSVTASVM